MHNSKRTLQHMAHCEVQANHLTWSVAYTNTLGSWTRHDDELRCHPASPKHGNIVVLHHGRIAKLRFQQVGHAQCCRSVSALQ